MRRSIDALNAQARLADHHRANCRLFRHVCLVVSELSDRSVSRESHALSFHTRVNIKTWPSSFFLLLLLHSNLLQWSPPCSFFRTKAEPYPRTPTSWPDPNGFLPPTVQQLSFILERRRGPKLWCGRDSFPALVENDLPSYEAVERSQCDRRFQLGHVRLA
ncbi:unnamed protein product [Prunus armeniaca]